MVRQAGVFASGVDACRKHGGRDLRLGRSVADGRECDLLLDLCDLGGPADVANLGGGFEHAYPIDQQACVDNRRVGEPRCDRIRICGGQEPAPLFETYRFSRAVKRPHDGQRLPDKVVALLPGGRVGKPGIFVDIAFLEKSQEQLRVTGLTENDALIGEIARGLMTGQVIDVLGRMKKKHVDALLGHRLLDPCHAPLELFGRERLPIARHLLNLRVSSLVYEKALEAAVTDNELDPRQVFALATPSLKGA